jgi:hypothetical protein
MFQQPEGGRLYRRVRRWGERGSRRYMRVARRQEEGQTVIPDQRI